MKIRPLYPALSGAACCALSARDSTALTLLASGLAPVCRERLCVLRLLAGSAGQGTGAVLRTALADRCSIGKGQR